VVGAGPAGLAAAHDLALLGYPVTVFEAQPVPGGMLRLGVPEYRLPRELIKLEINAILNLGVELRVGERLGRDFSLADLRRERYRAIFIAIGAHQGRTIEIEGLEFDGVLQGVDYLLNINMGYRVELGERVVVIGGGNVALDVARSALRAAVPRAIVNPEINIVTALDIARSAVRFGVKEVHVVSLESVAEIPAAREEVEQAELEGIILHPSRGPKRILGQGGVVTGLETIECAAVFDPEGRFAPRFVHGSELAMAADTVIFAIGQTSDLSFLSPEDGVRVTPRGTIAVNPTTLATSAPGVYCGGDVAFGPRIAIEAIADGRRAASSIHAYLRGLASAPDPLEVELETIPRFSRELEYEGLPRQKPPILPIRRRIGIAEVEQCLPEETARLEGSRCLRCWINTVFLEDPELGTDCVLCGACADVCPESCIELVPASAIAVDATLREDAIAEFGEAAEVFFGGEESRGTAILKDETRCIRCGLCAQRCPTGTVTMQQFFLVEAVHA
jgi:NADPH-dependent glutamate synthase beta subunit-like oxidoreductase/NAD-dependent dihydropyrimidine dehydrogenase PreA subunit